MLLLKLAEGASNTGLLAGFYAKEDDQYMAGLNYLQAPLLSLRALHLQAALP